MKKKGGEKRRSDFLYILRKMYGAEEKLKKRDRFYLSRFRHTIVSFHFFSPLFHWPAIFDD